MLRLISDRTGKSFAHDPAARGYHVVYRPWEVNHCPGCGRSQWLVGRLSAECAFCATALPLVEAVMQGAAGGHSYNRRPYRYEAEAA
ncbi:MAG TPA: hypothetical protein VGW34_04270 [Allosphingosinicella sp.]|nr:hypothetical protein [Allosphingosinicella sp.]